jgi:hypothetical protein
MSELSQKPTFPASWAMSALPPIADIRADEVDVRYVPEADTVRRLSRHLQILGRPERDFLACFDFDRFAGCGITAHAGCSISDL